jgi:hypothetical protein
MALLGAPIIDNLLEFGKTLVERLIPDPTERAKAEAEVLRLAYSERMQTQANDTALALKQAEINIEEAKSDSLFKGGWRPAVGWVCASAFAWQFVLGPVLGSVVPMFGIKFIQVSLSMSDMMPVLFGMLGLGAYRTYEKVKG